MLLNAASVYWTSPSVPMLGTTAGGTGGVGRNVGLTTPVVQTLQALSAKCNAFNLAPMDKRKMEDVAKRLGGLEAKLATGEISTAVFGSLSELCRALAGGDVQTALNIHVAITTSDWADNGQWLMGLKRLIEMVTKLQIRL